ncbi:MAG: cytochrome c [Gemmatimonadetes bacterium]|nr:cytochrome c [Gemmatimonadota bacterium]
MRSASACRLAAVALVLAGTSACKPLDDAMVAIFGRSMRDQRSFDPYENVRPAPAGSVSFSSSNFPGGPGTVNVGEPDGVDVVPFTQMDMIPIGTGNAVVQSLVNPFAMGDTAALARGQVLFLRHCAVCHSPDGVGAQAAIAGKHPTVAAYNLSGPIVAGYTDPYIYGMIRVGRGLMPSYGFRVPHYDRWRIVNYVRTLQIKAGNAPQAAAPQGGN